jgi:hypothetical protein
MQDGQERDGGMLFKYDVARHFSTTSNNAGFSSAAATRSLSFNCLLTVRGCQL